MDGIRPYKDQVYETLKNRHDSSDPFVDREFPASRHSLFPSGQSFLRSGRDVDDIVWRRPTEIVDDPQFVVNGFKCGDLDQGELGNCWFIAAANAIALHEDLRERIVPTDQSFDRHRYAGIFHFRFWSYGQWFDVVIDDQLPWHPEVGLLFCNNTKEKNEMWAALFEKAYAKFSGSYEAVIGGRIEEALMHMTGGMGEIIQVSARRFREHNFRETLKVILWQAHHQKSLLGCSISSSGGVPEGRLSNGLVQGHAYSITGIADVDTPDGHVTIVRCLNPWGNHEEWKGRFSDQSTVWNRISAGEKDRLRLHKRDDGEFWMSLEDFIDNFTEIQICHQSLTGFANDFSDPSLAWREIVFHGAWVSGSTAGGCGNDRPENYWRNPQYLIQLHPEHDTNNDQLCTMIIFLSVKKPHERHARRAEDDIGFQFRVYKVLDESEVDGSVEQGYHRFNRNQLKAIKDTGTYTNSIALSLRIDAEPGSYILIPSTFYRNNPAEFFFRIFIEAHPDPHHVASSALPWDPSSRDEDEPHNDQQLSQEEDRCSVM